MGEGKRLIRFGLDSGLGVALWAGCSSASQLPGWSRWLERWVQPIPSLAPHPAPSASRLASLPLQGSWPHTSKPLRPPRPPSRSTERTGGSPWLESCHTQTHFPRAWSHSGQQLCATAVQPALLPPLPCLQSNAQLLAVPALSSSTALL